MGEAEKARPKQASDEPKRPRCPKGFTPEQHAEWNNICSRLEEAGLLLKVGEGNIRSLAIYQAEVMRCNEYINEHGTTFVIKREGRPYQCPACKGTGIRKRAKDETDDQRAVSAARCTADTVRHRCSVCAARNREEIDAALLSGQSLRVVAKQFAPPRGVKRGLSPATLMRHKRECLAVAETAGESAASTQPAGPPCRFCSGKGAIPGRVTSQIIQFPEVAQRKIASDLVAKLSAQLGLDNVNLVRVRGKMPSAQRTQSRADALRSRATALRR